MKWTPVCCPDWIKGCPLISHVANTSEAQRSGGGEKEKKLIACYPKLWD